MTESDPLPEHRRPVLAVVVVVAVAIVLALAGGLSLLTGDGPVPSGAPPSTPTPAPTPRLEPGGFPAEVLGMPVVSVGDALALINSGAVDGRALAVGGWWLFSIDFPCPWSPVYVPPLLGDCHEYQGFASQGYQLWTCDYQGGPSGCGTGERPPGASEMELRFMPESVDDGAPMAAFNSFERRGAPAVLVGHAGDPRQLHCLDDTRANCRHQFVVDRVVWLAGHSVDQVAAIPDVVHGMVPEEAVAAARKDGQPIVALALRSRDLPALDPRFHGVGDSSVWIVRTLRSDEAAAPEDPTRGVDVTLVDDATGQILASTGLEMAADYQPGFVLIQATETVASADDELYPYYRIETADGVGVQEMRIGGDSSSSGDPVKRYGAGLPAVVEPGDYVVRAWRSQAGRDAPIGVVLNACATNVHVDALGELRLEAHFPASGACTFVTPTFEGFLDS